MKKAMLLITVVTAAALSLSTIQASPNAAPALAVVPYKMVTLTFDDGPDKRFTPEVLKLLSQEGLHATFFVVGRNAINNPALLAEMYHQGHVIANHTQTHPQLEELPISQVTAEIAAADNTLQTILGPVATPHYFRPPRGKVTPEIAASADKLNKQLILWNVCVENHTTQTPDEVRNRVMKLIRERNGGILLAHDGELDRSLTVQSLPLIIHDLKQEGYNIVSLDEYLKAQKRKEAE